MNGLNSPVVQLAVVVCAFSLGNLLFGGELRNKALMAKIAAGAAIVGSFAFLMA